MIITDQHAVYNPAIAFSLPQAKIGAGSWLILGTFVVPSGATASYQSACLDLIELGTAPHTITGASGISSLGIYADFDAAVHPRSQTPVETAIYAGASGTTGRVQAVRTGLDSTYSSAGAYTSGNLTIFASVSASLAPGTYSMVVANNVDNQDATIAATAVIQITR